MSQENSTNGSATRTTTFNIFDAAIKETDAQAFQRIRIEVLNITQIECVQLITGGGHNAVSRYEDGITAIPQSAMMLMLLLEKQPHLLEEIRRFRC